MNQFQQTSTAQQVYHNTDTPGISDRQLDDGIADDPSTLDLVYRLCQALEGERITYCHWKSNNAIDRSASGDNDLDLLVSRADGPSLGEVLGRLGFKPARAPAEKDMPGVLDYFGYDTQAGKLVHVHAHYQLVLGHDLSKNYRLPIEKPYLESAVQRGLFRLPAPEFEFVVFVIRMVLKHLTWEAVLGREAALSAAEQKELAYLQARVDPGGVEQVLRRHLPYLDGELFFSCVDALRPACSLRTRLKTGRRLLARLQTNGRRSRPLDGGLKLWRRVVLAARRRISKSSSKYRLGTGGALIAIVGGDGAGKSTAVDALYAWLSRNFETHRIHLGKPAWSWTTIAVRSILKLGQLIGLYPVETAFNQTLKQESFVSPGFPWLLREVCRARDRYWTYVKARRLAARGGLVLLDRFPVPQAQLTDGPLAARFVSQLADGPQAGRLLSQRRSSRLAQALIRLEEDYYRQIAPPELLIVLRVDPETAVQRKAGEDAAFVRERAAEIWELNWENTGAHVIDAGKSRTDVLVELRAILWSEL